MDFNTIDKRKIAKWVIGVVTVCILVFLGVQNIHVISDFLGWLLSLFMPLIIGFAIAVILNVPMRFFESVIWVKTKRPFLQKMRRPVCFAIALIMILGMLVGVVLLVIPELVNAVKIVAQGIIGLVDKFSTMTEEEFSELPFAGILLSIDWDEILSLLQNWLKNQSENIVHTAFGTITVLVGGVFNFFISFVFSIYVLFNKDILKKQFCRLVRVWLSKKFGDWLTHAASVANLNFRNFVSGQSIEAVILGVLCMIGMFILGLPYAPMVGALVGVTALIPVVGAFVGLFVGAFMILTVSPVKAVVFIIFLNVLQQIEGNVIYPKVMGSRVNLPGMWILASVTVGGGVAGAIGMLLSVPVASTVYVLFKEITAEREKKLKKQNSDKKGDHIENCNS